ncbi:MAG: hypothetical protein CW716_04480 [Candidatus Bathyarchaeum sp.]|nr:MAG: hypothetical protein CW716_04480 [Candidatus Bathyarchaeum sp.]
MASDVTGNNFLKEWEEARHVLRTYDDRLHDLRKFGFSFITAFLTTSTILFENWIRPPGTDFAGEPLPELVKATILGVTMLLIFGLFLLDRNFRVLHKAVSIRTNILERLLNIEVTDVISQRYMLSGIQICVTTLYLFFIVAACLLGSQVLSRTMIFVYGMGVFLGGLIVLLSFDFVVLRYRYRMIDWIVDKTECKQGDGIRIIMTNICGKDFPKDEFKAETLMWKLTKEENDNGLRFGEVPAGFKLSPSDNKIWILETGETDKGEKELDVGIYRLFRRVCTCRGALMEEDEMIPLKRKLRVLPPDGKPEPTKYHVVLAEDAEVASNEEAS